MKTFTYSLDSLLSKPIKVDLNKCKTIFDLKMEIASDLHVDSKSISLLNEKYSELSKFEYNHEFIVSINSRHKSLAFIFKFPNDYLEIYIENCYKMTLDEIINEFKKKQLFYSDTCIKHYMQFNNSGKEVPHIKYPFIAITSDWHIQVKINCEYVILNYGYKKFILSDTEYVYDVICLIRKIYSNCSSILIQDKYRKKINEYEKLNKDEIYNIIVLFTVKFQELRNSKSSFSQEIDFLTKVDDVKQIIAQKYSKSKYNIKIYDEDYKQITDSYKTLKSFQYLDKIFYFDNGSNDQVKISPMVDEYEFKSNENKKEDLNSQFKYKFKEHDLNISSKFISKDNFGFDDDDDDTLDTTEDESNFEPQSTNQSSSNESSDFDSSHQNKPNISSDQKLYHQLNDDKYQSKQTSKSEKKIWTNNQNQSYISNDLNRSNDDLYKDDGVFSKIIPKKESKHEQANDINYTDSDDFSYQNNQQIGPESKNKLINSINYTDSNDYSDQSNQQIESENHLINQNVINDDSNKSTSFKNIYSKPFSNYKQTDSINYTDSNDYSYHSKQPIKSEYHLTSQNVANNDLNKIPFSKICPKNESKNKPANNINYTDSDDYSYLNNQQIKSEHHLTNQDVINDDLNIYPKSKSNYEQPTTYINHNDLSNDSYKNNQLIGSEYHFTKQNIINDDLKKYKNQFNKISSNLKSNHEPTDNVNYTDSDDYSNQNDQSDKPKGSEYHFTKQSIINDDLKKYDSAFNKINSNLKSNHEQTDSVNYTDSDDYSNQNNQSDKPIESEYHFTKQSIINDDLRRYQNQFNKISSNLKSNHEPTDNVNYTDSDGFSNQNDQSDKPKGSEYHFTKQNIINDDLKKHNNSFSKTNYNPESNHDQTSNTYYTDTYDYSYQSDKPKGSEYHFTKQNIINDDLKKHSNSFSKTNYNPESNHEQTSNTYYTDSYYYSYQSDQPVESEYHPKNQNIIDDDSKKHDNSFSKTNYNPESSHDQTSNTYYTDTYDYSYQSDKPKGSEYHFTKQNIINDDLKISKKTFNKIRSNIKSKDEPSTHNNCTDSDDYSYQSDKPKGSEYHFTKQDIINDDLGSGKHISKLSNKKLFNNSNNYKTKPESKSKSQSHIINSKYQFNNNNSNNFDLTNSENYFSEENKNVYNLEDHDTNSTKFSSADKPKNPDLNQKQKPLSDDIFVSNDYNDIEVSDEIEVNHCKPILEEEEEENENLYKEEVNLPKSHNILSSSDIEHHEKENVSNVSIIEEEEEVEDVDLHQNDEHDLKSHNISSSSDIEHHKKENISNVSIIEEEDDDDDLHQNDEYDLKSHNISSSSSDIEHHKKQNVSNVSIIEEEEEEVEDVDLHQNDEHDLKSHNISSSSDCEVHEDANMNDNISIIEEEEVEDLHRESDLSSHNLLSFSSDDGTKNNNNDKL